jgi:16S rRNA G966 N2-methylase RsmD
MQFDYVYVAPPQYKEMWVKAIESLDSHPDWLVEDGWAIAQIDPREYKPLELEGLLEFDQRKYGSTLLVFYERKPSDE